MPKDEIIRLSMHLPHGMLAGWAMFGFPLPYLIPIEPTWLTFAIGVVLLTAFMVYQVFNQVGKAPDDSWKDVQGICWGLALAVVVFGVLWRLL